MPSVVLGPKDPSYVLNQIVVSPSDTDYLDQLIPFIREYSNGNRTSQLLQSLSKFAVDKEGEIETVREGTVNLTSDILNLNQEIQDSTEKLAETKKALVESRGVRQNIDEASRALQDCLEVLQLSNRAQNLLNEKKYYAALRALDELQNVHLREVTQYRLAAMIQRSVPHSQVKIAEDVTKDVQDWLFRIREASQFLGELAFYHTDLRKSRQKERIEKEPYLEKFKLNSAIELVSDELEEYDLLQNDNVDIEFKPLFEAVHIHRSLNQMEEFRAKYASIRRDQKNLMLPPSISLVDNDGANLHQILEEMAGFGIIERSTMKRIPDLRSTVDVDELWDSLCQTAISLILKALPTVDNAENLQKMKNVVALFIQSMDSWGFTTTTFDNLLLTLFEKYAELLKRRFSDDFQEIVSTDDYMPMPIQNVEEFEKVVNVSWYTPEKLANETNFPCVLPFSQMYPLCCIDIRNFINQFYWFSADDFHYPNVIDETLRKALDDLLSEKVCASLVERLNSQYLGQIVQILINLEHFEFACQELEKLLLTHRQGDSTSAQITLSATDKFRSNKKTAEKRIFEVVNSKIDDLIETAEYEWMSTSPQTEPSNYIQTLTRYLSNIMTSVLLGLPTEIKELIYFDALSHAANMILDLPLSPHVRTINPHGVAALARDVQFLTSFVDSLGNLILLENLEELQQTVHLLQTDNPDEYYDVALRNRKYGRVNPSHGQELLQKLTHSVASPTKADKFSAFSSRFGMK